MPNTKSAIKAAKQNLKRRVTNLKALDAIRKSAKSFKKLASAGGTDAQKALSAAFAALDKAAKKHIIHKNTASRKKSRLAKMIAKVK